MKALKIFIVLFGMMTLVQTNINAQLIRAINVTMDLPTGSNGPYANATTVFADPQVQCHGTITIPLICNEPRIIVVKVYSTGLYSIAEPRDLLVSDTSGSPTMSYTTTLNFDCTGKDEVYIECGFIDNNGIYREDSGCVVIIQPY